MKIAFVVIDCLGILGILLTLKAIRKNIQADYGKWLGRTLTAAIVAIIANILIAVSFNSAFAGVAFSLYFASIDWIIYFLVAFVLLYTEHKDAQRLMVGPSSFILALDSFAVLANPVLGYEFRIIETIASDGTVFYQTKALIPYYIHLAIDYIAILVTIYLLVSHMASSYNVYRIKCIIILSALIFVVVLNIIYMALELPLDASVLFYGLGGVLIYISIQVFVPKSLKMMSVAQAIDDMNEGLILFDISKNCIYANAFSKERFSIDVSTLTLDSEVCADVIAELDMRGTPFGAVKISRETGIKENPVAHYNVRYNRLNDNKGRIIGTYFLVEDITEQIHYIEEVKKAQNMADDASQAKSSFLANMSHEIRTPLNSVLGMNEMIMRSTEDPALLEYAQNIKTSGDTLLGLISDILDFSKIEAGKTEPIPADYNPQDLLRECVGSFEQIAEIKDLFLTVTCDEKIPMRLNGDQKLIKQVLANIISNAIKYTHTGGVTVDMRQEGDGDDSRNIIINVTDTGIGISENDIKYLFEPFRRVNESKNASIQGTGLGLAITKELVALMGGEISVKSAIGSGSTFSINIPQKIVDATPAGEFKRHISMPEKKYRESFHAEDACILAVDDAKMNLKVIQSLLKKTRIKIDIATGGNEAIEMCRNKQYDVILLDHRMPDPDGIETFCIISADGMNTDTPVIMLTANVNSSAEEDYKKMGFADYLAKPLRGEDLEAILLKHLPPEKTVITYEEK